MENDRGPPSVLSIILTIIAVIVGFGFMLLWRGAREVSSEWNWEIWAVGGLAIVLGVLAKRIGKR